MAIWHLNRGEEQQLRLWPGDHVLIHHMYDEPELICPDGMRVWNVTWGNKMVTDFIADDYRWVHSDEFFGIDTSRFDAYRDDLLAFHEYRQKLIDRARGRSDR